jgi:hypothetical protein
MGGAAAAYIVVYEADLANDQMAVTAVFQAAQNRDAKD